MIDVEELKRRFRECYPEAGEAFVCRAPGRVNLIGEHMDYNGLPVLPMAIAQEIRIAFAPRTDGVITMQNVDPNYPRVRFENSDDIERSGAGSWENYCKAAVQSLNRNLEKTSFPGMDLLITADLPVAAGLSSSSALVVACALAYLGVLDQTLGRDVSRLELADMMARAEQYVGTRGGGMDQTVILNGEAGHACKIDFFPIRVELAPVPDDYAIVVCDSLVKVEKSGAALARFNAGPWACRLACGLIEQQAREEFGDEVELKRLGDLWFGPLCLTHDEARGLCERAIPKETMTLAEVCARLGQTEEMVRRRYIDTMQEPEGGFPLQRRLRHQLTEFKRVETARDALQAGDAEEMGRLMNASHASCADDFGISSRELDALVAAARESGAVGSRLTGAGFGGATVNLVPLEKVEAFIAGVTASYYHDFLKHAGEPPIFVAEARSGADYY